MQRETRAGSIPPWRGPCPRPASALSSPFICPVPSGGILRRFGVPEVTHKVRCTQTPISDISIGYLLGDPRGEVSPSRSVMRARSSAQLQRSCSSPLYSDRRGCSDAFKTDGRSQLMRVWPRHPGRAARSIERTGSVQSRQLATANNLDPARLAMAAQSAALSSQRLVSRTGQPQRGPSAQDNHRGIGAKATGRALEIRDHRCRYRRRYDEGCLANTPTSNPVISPGPDQSWRIQVDEP